MEAAAVRLSGFRGGVEWAGGRWRLVRRSMVAASALESLVEHGLQSVVKIDRSSSVHGWRSERWIGDEGGVG